MASLANVNVMHLRAFLHGGSCRILISKFKEHSRAIQRQNIYFVKADMGFVTFTIHRKSKITKQNIYWHITILLVQYSSNLF